LTMLKKVPNFTMNSLHFIFIFAYSLRLKF